MLERVSLNESIFPLISSRDTASFFKTFMTEPNWKPDMSLFVNSTTQLEDSRNPRMITVTVRFQLFDKSEPGNDRKGTSYEWKCYRAKDWSCSQMSIQQAC